MSLYVPSSPNTTANTPLARGRGPLKLKQSTSTVSTLESAPTLPTQAEAVAQNLDEISWHRIEVAGRQFQVSSRRSQSHMQEVERLLAETHAEVKVNLEGHPPLHAALLTAINLADQLICREQGHAVRQSNLRIKSLLGRLDQVFKHDAK